MALVKKFRLELDNWGDEQWTVTFGVGKCHAKNADLNRAIVECVAKMQAAKSGAVQNGDATELLAYPSRGYVR